jgi:hypothetical protein
MLMTVWAWAEAAKPSAEAPMRSDLNFMNVWCVCVWFGVCETGINSVHTAGENGGAALRGP